MDCSKESDIVRKSDIGSPWGGGAVPNIGTGGGVDHCCKVPFSVTVDATGCIRGGGGRGWEGGAW